MDLPSYIDKIGLEAAAAQFGVSYSAIAMWRRRERVPRPDKAQEIVRATKGKVTLSEIYAPRAA